MWRERLHQGKGAPHHASLTIKAKNREILLLYLAGSEHAVSAVLVWEEGKRKYLVYYVNISLLNAETQYNHLENLVIALVVETRKSCPDIVQINVNVLSQ